MQEKGSLLLKIALTLIIFGGFCFFGKTAFASAADNISGFAWSENIGWISFNCTDTLSCGVSNYGVNGDRVTRELTGFAWSDSVGWIKFDPTAVGCPGVLPCTPKIVRNAGVFQLEGWARACTGTVGEDCVSASRSDWDGWISLSCSNDASCGSSDYHVTVSDPPACTFDGYSWGSDITGWISFSNVTDGTGIPYGVVAIGGGCVGGGALPISVSCKAEPNPSFVGQQVTWKAEASGGIGALTCTWTGDDGLSAGPIPCDTAITHRYVSPNTYHAQVIARDADPGTPDDAASCDVTILARRREAPPESP